MIERLGRATVRPDAWLADPAATVPVEDLDEVSWPPGEAPPGTEALCQQLAACEPGPELATLLATLTPHQVGQPALLEAITATERLVRWATAMQYAVLSEAQRRTVLGQVTQTELNSEISTRLAISPRAADQRAGQAFDVHHFYPAAWQAMARGDIDRGKANVIAAETAFLHKHVSQEREDRLTERLAERAVTLTHTKLRALARKSVAALIPAKVEEERHEAARENRRVILSPTHDGMAELWALLPAPDAIAAMTVIDRLATKRNPDDDRIIDQRRADAFARVFRSLLDSGESLNGALPTAQRQRPHLMLHVTPTAWPGGQAAPAAAKSADTSHGLTEPRGPSIEIDLDGYGPITPTMALRAASNAIVSLVMCDPATGERHHTELAPGHVTAESVLLGFTAPNPAAEPAGRGESARAGPGPPLSDPTGGKIDWKARKLAAEWTLSSTGYRPQVELVRSILLRDGTCTFPTCRIAAWRCDLDHIVPFDDSEPADEQTTERNLHTVCRTHHRLKTLFDWNVQRDPHTGITKWISPTGHVSLRKAEYLEALA